ncbi:hypothetical protein EK904_011881 [Melospiza melodia maxima]|nr:hypothetical protein EK904_011881 [Melospiza melodia maxima]
MDVSQPCPRCSARSQPSNASRERDCPSTVARQELQDKCLVLIILCAPKNTMYIGRKQHLTVLPLAEGGSLSYMMGRGIDNKAHEDMQSFLDVQHIFKAKGKPTWLSTRTHQSALPTVPGKPVERAAKILTAVERCGKARAAAHRSCRNHHSKLRPPQHLSRLKNIAPGKPIRLGGIYMAVVSAEYITTAKAHSYPTPKGAFPQMSLRESAFPALNKERQKGLNSAQGSDFQRENLVRCFKEIWTGTTVQFLPTNFGHSISLGVCKSQCPPAWMLHSEGQISENAHQVSQIARQGRQLILHNHRDSPSQAHVQPHGKALGWLLAELRAVAAPSGEPMTGLVLGDADSAKLSSLNSSIGTYRKKKRMYGRASEPSPLECCSASESFSYSYIEAARTTQKVKPPGSHYMSQHTCPQQCPPNASPDSARTLTPMSISLSILLLQREEWPSLQLQEPEKSKTQRKKATAPKSLPPKMQAKKTVIPTAKKKTAQSSGCGTARAPKAAGPPRVSHAAGLRLQGRALTSPFSKQRRGKDTTPDRKEKAQQVRAASQARGRGASRRDHGAAPSGLLSALLPSLPGQPHTLRPWTHAAQEP